MPRPWKWGILVYAYDTPIADVEVPYIGIDNETVGYELARVLADKMEHKGNIAHHCGQQAADIP